MSADWSEDLQELKDRREIAKNLGGADAIQRQHDKGKLTARERIDILLDEGSFEESAICCAIARILHRAP